MKPQFAILLFSEQFPEYRNDAIVRLEMVGEHRNSLPPHFNALIPGNTFELRLSM